MFVASAAQLRRLLDVAGAEPPSAVSLLDIGAGQGSPTAMFAAALHVPASRVAVIESSAPLRRSLRASGYTAAAGFGQLRSHVGTFGAVSLLNVLDRCDDPHSVLAAAVAALRPSQDSLLFVATVLPFCARVYEGALGKLHASRPPIVSLRLPPPYHCHSGPPFGLIGRPSFEQHAAAFAAEAFRSLPLRVMAWTRLPYLSSGDLGRSYYYLPNVLFMLRHTGERRNVTHPLSQPRPRVVRRRAQHHRPRY